MIKTTFKTIAIGLVALATLAAPSHAADVNESVFGGLADTAPRSLFDQISETAPRSPFDQIGDSAPRSVFADIEATAPLTSEASTLPAGDGR